jgi:hypothetical protein
MDLPVYAIPRMAAPVSFEKLTAGHFSKAPRALLCDAVDGSPPAQRTEARLMWDSRFLYGLFVCEENSPLAALTGHDQPLYNENVVEIFLDPLSTGHVYYELEVNPLNASYDALILNDIQKSGPRGRRFQGFPAWNPKSFAHSSRVENGVWTVSLRIGFEDLCLSPNIPPKAGDTWRGNLLRIDRDEKNQRCCAWSPPRVLDFHNSKAFGIFQFTD